MAKTEDGKKIVSVRECTRRGRNGKLIKVSAHKRSTPN